MLRVAEFILVKTTKVDACEQAGLPCPIIAERTGGIAVELLKNPVTTRANVTAGLSGKRRGSAGEASGKRRESVGKASGKRRE